MRNFEERKAEVFRRSEQRIKKRQRIRNRILFTCIPVLVCIAVWSVTGSPAINFAKKNELANSDGAIYEYENGIESFVCSYTEVLIQSADENSQNHAITDKVQVTQIFNYVHRFYNSNSSFSDADDSIGKTDKTTKDELKDFTNGTVPDYTLTFITEDGSKTVYTLKGNELKEGTANQTVTLTESQLSELKAVLGLLE